MFPTEDLRRRTDAAVEALAAATTLRFTNRAGTDVTYRIGYPVKAQYGYVDSPGQWDHWPSGGMVLTCGEDDGIDGTRRRRSRRHPAAVQAVRAGADRVRDRGRPHHRDPRRRLPGGAHPPVHGRLRRPGRVRALAHRLGPRRAGEVGGARAPTAAATAWSCGRSAATCSSRPGPNDLVGGPNHTSCHLDIPMRNCSLFLDDRPVIVDGEVVVDVDAARPSAPAAST